MSDEERGRIEEYIRLLKENNLGEIELTDEVGNTKTTVIIRSKK